MPEFNLNTKASSATPEHTNRLFHGDNIDVIRKLKSNSIDLIYLDPPYNSKRILNSRFRTKSEAKVFNEKWSWGQTQIRWLNAIHERNKNAWFLLDCLMKTFKRNDGLPAYLVAMTVRLIEMHRVLKNTGSIYLHLNPTVSHYLKLVMDQIFGTENFQNEIIWDYQDCWLGSLRKASMPSKHDVIFWYSKGKEFTYNPQFKDYKPEYKALYKQDKKGTFYRKKWRALPDGTKYTVKQKMGKGIPYTDVWQLPAMTGPCKEHLGYPTQKPMALLERIVLIGSNEGDVVLDPYLGSGTTIEAAEKLGRNWMGIDVTHHAVAYTLARLTTNLDLEDDDIAVIDEPLDLKSAKDLHNSDRAQYAAWAILNLKASPHQAKDGQLIGIREAQDYIDSRTIVRKALYVTSNNEPPSIADVDRLEHLMKDYKADLGFLVAFTMPDELSLNRIQWLGELHQNNGRFVVPKVQVITVKEILELGASAAKLFDTSRQHCSRLSIAKETQIAMEG